MKKWIDRFINKLTCGLYGHGPFYILHVYETRTVARFLCGKHAEELRVGGPLELIYEHQKHLCLMCGKVSLAWTLIGAIPHTDTKASDWQ